MSKRAASELRSVNTSTGCRLKAAAWSPQGSVPFTAGFPCHWSEEGRSSFTSVNIYAQGNLRSTLIYPTHYVREMFFVGYRKREEGACGGSRRGK